MQAARRSPLALLLVALVVPALTLGACSGASGRRSELADWSAGPARWLLLAAEQRRLKQLTGRSDSIAFLEAFWARRDPDLDQPGNPFAETFFRRVEAADQLYAEGMVRGSLTDRGRALILLGPPSRIRILQQPALDPEHSRSPGQRVSTTEVSVEEWGYSMRDMTPAFQAEFEHDPERPVSLRFLIGEERTRLIEGEYYLNLAARTAAGQS